MGVVVNIYDSPLSLHIHEPGLIQQGSVLFLIVMCIAAHIRPHVCTVLCVPGGLLWKDCVMWVHQNGSRETCPARYDFMSYVSLRWGQRSINPVCVCVRESV